MVWPNWTVELWTLDMHTHPVTLYRHIPDLSDCVFLNSSLDAKTFFMGQVSPDKGITTKKIKCNMFPGNSLASLKMAFVIDLEHSTKTKMAATAV